MPVGTDQVVGVLLAGGRSSRMGGGDKCLLPLAGHPMLDHVIARARPQVAQLILNANGGGERFARFQLPIAADPVDGFAGPLAGVLAALEWAQAVMPGCPWVVSFATDTPFLPRDLVATLLAAMERERGEMACAASQGRAHPTFGLWPVRLAAALRHALVAEGIRKIDHWTARYRLVTAEFSAEPCDPFFNVNRPDDVRTAEGLLAHGGVVMELGR
ncbi:MAG: molybdenum cofactor guanylyltransferase MobA [Rhodospirillales bacterium]|nr:molybdenum cofactor guanylyltransferase MobA [Rhodospirillales bacterium]